MKSLIKLWGSLPKRRQKQFWLLIMLMLLASFAEILSLGAILPFLGTIADPEYIFFHPHTQPIIHILKIKSPNDLLLPLTLVFISAVILSGLIRLALLYVMTRFSYSTGADISIDIYKRTLHQPYAIHIARNSSELINSIIVKTETVCNGVIQPILFIISSTFIFSSILVALFTIDFFAALVSTIGFGALYWVIMRFTKSTLNSNSYKVAAESTKVIQSLQEGLGGIRDVILDGNQRYYTRMYRASDLPLRRAQGDNSFITGSPRFLMEAVGMCLIAFLAFILSQSDGGITKAIPVLGALALGAQRLLPALQQIYNSISTIRGSKASFEDVMDLISQPLPQDIEEPLSSMKFKSNIKLVDVSFKYSDDLPDVIKSVNLNIKSGFRVGFFGETGSGKSTLFDIIMGLLKPSKGTVEVDGVEINSSNVKSWQSNIAHVPQNIYLSDASVAENIAFGCEKDNINYQEVKKAAKKAQIDNFILEMPEKYQTKVGERGVRLSGGQRQRIGIARALYKKAKVIILDEATSALDDNTEAEVMSSVEALSQDLTILIIAHRLTTLKNCDQIVELGNTGIIRVGSYNELVLNNT